MMMSNEKIRKRLGKIHIDKIADNHPLLAAVSAWEGEKKKKKMEREGRRGEGKLDKEALSHSHFISPPPYKLST